MVCLATSGKPSFVPSLIELDPPASPFSVDTLGKFTRRIDQGRGIFYFIAGGDSLAEVKSWRESEKLLTSYNFIFVLRPGTRPIDPREVLPEQAIARVRNLSGMGRVQMRRQIEEAESLDENRIYIVDVAAPDISATQIRFQASAKMRFKPAVPGPVCDYIRKLNLYGER
jgi:nicotinate (nicotinamide) nucleotide adenylyltransferase